MQVKFFDLINANPILGFFIVAIASTTISIITTRNLTLNDDFFGLIFYVAVVSVIVTVSILALIWILLGIFALSVFLFQKISAGIGYLTTYEGIVSMPNKITIWLQRHTRVRLCLEYAFRLVIILIIGYFLLYFLAWLVSQGVSETDPITNRRDLIILLWGIALTLLVEATMKATDKFNGQKTTGERIDLIDDKLTRIEKKLDSKKR
ncbi:MAG: hypothetical protein WC821_03915 [archaeon]|jgi:hypothetical protein